MEERAGEGGGPTCKWETEQRVEGEAAGEPLPAVACSRLQVMPPQDPRTSIPTPRPDARWWGCVRFKSTARRCCSSWWTMPPRPDPQGAPAPTMSPPGTHVGAGRCWGKGGPALWGKRRTGWWNPQPPVGLGSLRRPTAQAVGRPAGCLPCTRQAQRAQERACHCGAGRTRSWCLRSSRGANPASRCWASSASSIWRGRSVAQVGVGCPLLGGGPVERKQVPPLEAPACMRARVRRGGGPRFTQRLTPSKPPCLPPASAPAPAAQTPMTTTSKRGWRAPRSTSRCWHSRNAFGRWTAMPGEAAAARHELLGSSTACLFVCCGEEGTSDWCRPWLAGGGGGALFEGCDAGPCSSPWNPSSPCLPCGRRFP